MDESRARSFGAVAAEYARHRPGYPVAAVEWALAPLAGRNPTDVLDLGAGTGALTRTLAARPGRHVLAVEPDPQMLAELRRRLPDVEAVAGRAEAIPLPDAALDAVLVGQAMHWFDLSRALPEIRRVLRPGGVLAALWNADDHTVDWVAGYQQAAEQGRRVPGVPPGTNRPQLPAWPGMGDEVRAEFAHTQRLTAEGLIAVLSTHSWALTSDPDDRAAAFARVRAYLAGRPETQGEFDLPLVTTVLRAVHRSA